MEKNPIQDDSMRPVVKATLVIFVLTLLVIFIAREKPAKEVAEKETNLVSISSIERKESSVTGPKRVSVTVGRPRLAQGPRPQQ